MLFFYLSEAYAPWLAPYAYGIVLLGFLLFLFRFFENLYAAQFNKPLFRHYFISEKRFIGRDNLIVTERMSVLIAAVGCMLSFGRKNYSYSLINVVLIYPDQFFSVINNNYHKGEFNPKEKTLVFSWSDFEKGFKITNDNLNVGIHEFMHAMQLEAKTSRDLDSLRFSKHFQNILKQLTLQNVKDKIDKTAFFRAYAFSNQYEFMAVLAEYFFESPTEFKSQFPKIYDYTKKLLNFNFAQY
ncbi:zinc-dependent peptidase [Aequorivita viscosa]|nr:zinc-dependent peptidase [Aequorivita viscosa]